jgi:hypothetical protein
MFRNHPGRHPFQAARRFYDMYGKLIDFHSDRTDTNNKEKRCRIARKRLKKTTSDAARLKNTRSQVLTPPLPYGRHNVHSLS